MSESITIREGMQFKSKALQTATDSLRKAAVNIDKSRKEACVILWRVEKSKAYAEDGFKSLEEYASRIGLDKSLAHKMADAGKLFDSENPTVKQFAAGTDYSKLAMLASENPETVKDAIETGALKSDMTAKEVIGWKKANASKKAESKATVLPEFELDFIVYTITGARSIHYDKKAPEAVKELEGVKWANIETGKDAEGKPIKTRIGLLPNGDLVRVTLWERVKPEAKGKAKGKAKSKTLDEMTDAELEAYLAARRAAKRAEG